MLAAPPLGLGSFQAAPVLSSLRSPSQRFAVPRALVLLELPDRLLDRLMHPGVQSCLGRFHLAGPLLELSLPLLRRLLLLFEGVALAPKQLLHVGGEGLLLIKGLPALLQLRLGNSQLAGPLLQLFAPSLQSCREIVELLPPDLETLVASLKLGPLGREASLKFGPLSRLPLR